MASPSKSERIKNAIDFMQNSRLIDMKQPIESVLGSVKTLSAASGEGDTNDYVLAWERYVLVVAPEASAAPSGSNQ